MWRINHDGGVILILNEPRFAQISNSLLPTTSPRLSLAADFLVYFLSFRFVNSFSYMQIFYSHPYLAEHSPSTIAIIGSL